MFLAIDSIFITKYNGFMQKIAPQVGPQTEFLQSSADIAIYGGAAGGGKTWALLLEPLRHIENPDFRGIIFRRNYPQVVQQGGLWDKASEIYPYAGGEGNQHKMLWKFPSGAVVAFGHLNREADKHNHQGAEYAFIGFDELTHFTESQYLYLLSRNRSLSGVKPYVRATCNPDADSWVLNWIKWWIDPDAGYPVERRAGRVRYYTYQQNNLTLFPSPVKDSKSLVFIPSTIYDNRKLLAADPDYLKNLLALDHVERMRLLEGNWMIRSEGGQIFNRGSFNVVEPIDVPVGGIAIRYWDLASTAVSHKNKDPDYTAGGLMKRVGNTYYVTDVKRFRENPGRTDNLIIETTSNDLEMSYITKTYYMVGIEIEPGSSGKREFARMVHLLQNSVSASLNIQGRRPSGDKVTRAKPFASVAQVGDIYVARREWTQTYLNEMHNFPMGAHDDLVDVSTGAHLELAEYQSTYSQLMTARSYSYK